MQASERLDGRTLFAIAVALLTWSSAYAAIAYALPSFSPGQVAFSRLLIAVLCFVLLLLVKRVAWPAPRDWPALFVLGLIGMGTYHLCLAIAETRVASGTAAILISLVPAATAAVSAVWLRERLEGRKLVGLGVAFVGVVIVVLASGKGLHFEPMAALVLVCVAASAIFFVGQRPYFSRSSTLGVTALTLLAGTIGTAPFGAGSLYTAILAAPWTRTAALVWLGVAPTFIGYIAWNLAIKRSSASQVSSFIYLSPPIAVLIGWLWLDEKPTILVLLGGALTVAGVVLVNLRRRVAPVAVIAPLTERP